MKNPYEGTRTEQNLMKAFQAEATASAKYTYFASVARKEGYEQIADIFLKTAGNEKEHGKIWAKHLCIISNTPTNLFNAVQAEHEEWVRMYKEMAQTASEEGFYSIANQFLQLAKIEERHEERFNALFNNIDTNEVFTKTGICIWECRNCGHIVVSESAPSECPVCLHPQSYFELRATNY